MSDRGKLGDFLREVIDWDWEKFCRAENDPSYSPLQGTVFALIRACADGKLGAIKLGIKRVDGNLETPIKVEYPKIFFTYPYAKSVAGEPVAEITSGEEPTPEDFEEIKPDENSQEALITYGLRETLNKMADTPDRRIVPLILRKKQEVEDVLDGKIDTIKPLTNVPMVKTVIAAHLLDLAIEQNNFEAITEVFDQIDGKLVETLRIMGDDMYMTQYTEIAPAGAVMQTEGKYKGMYVLEQENLADQWAAKLQSSKKL